MRGVGSLACVSRVGRMARPLLIRGGAQHGRALFACRTPYCRATRPSGAASGLLACGVAPDAGAGYLRSGSLTWRPNPWTPRAIGAAHRQFARSSRRPTWRRRPGSSPRHETGVASRMVGA